MKNQTVQISDVRAFMARHLANVFDTMASLKATLLPQSNAPEFSERVTSSMGIAGEKVTGTVYLHLSLPLANQMTSAMLRLDPNDIPPDALVNDAVGDITNMLAGGLKSWLNDADIQCSVSIPVIIRSTSLNIEPPPDVRRECLVFDCGDDRFSVEIHIKFN
jgi:CheY-specific phosphatase CheX